jgi:hypothetical protein
VKAFSTRNLTWPLVRARNDIVSGLGGSQIWLFAFSVLTVNYVHSFDVFSLESGSEIRSKARQLDEQRKRPFRYGTERLFGRGQQGRRCRKSERQEVFELLLDGAARRTLHV